MKLISPQFLAAFLFILILSSCGQESIEKSNSPTATEPNTSERSMAVLLGLRNNMLSGLPVLHPAIMTIDHGAVLAFRAGTPDAGYAISAIASGERVEDTEDRKREVQAALETLLDSEGITLESVAGEGEKIILLFSPDKSLGECPPCNELFETLRSGEIIGDFTIKKVVIENR